MNEILTDREKAREAMANDTICEIEDLYGISRTEFDTERATVNGKHLNFYFYVRTEFCRKLQGIDRKNYHAAKNDQGDLLNMVYVGLNDKYWVDEPKWVKNINDAGLTSFIFRIEDIALGSGLQA